MSLSEWLKHLILLYTQLVKYRKKLYTHSNLVHACSTFHANTICTTPGKLIHKLKILESIYSYTYTMNMAASGGASSYSYTPINL